MDNGILTAKQAAKLLQVNIQTVYNWSAAGLIGQRVGTGKRKSWRFTETELRNLVRGEDSATTEERPEPAQTEDKEPTQSSF